MKKLIFFTLYVLLLTGCNSSDKQHQHEESAVQLNHGDRWEANPETTDGINTMINRIQRFNTDHETDYDKLKADLQESFKGIFQKCTMKGEAHDQLHNYLMPLKKELDTLSAENIDTVHAYLETYDTYFQ
jgi:hypothetical protein